jgi:hypothetical protein
MLTDAQTPDSSPPPTPPTVAPAAKPGHVIDETVLNTLPDEAFINFSRTRFAALKLQNPQDVLLAALEDSAIALIVKVAKERNMLRALLQPDSIVPAPRVTVPSGAHPEEVSGFDATMASDIGQPAPQPPPLPAPRVSRPPPPPPRRKSMPPAPSAETAGVPLSDIGVFLRNLRQSGDSTKDRLQQAEGFFQQKLREALAENGQAAFKAAEVSAKKKQMQLDAGEQVMLTPLERIIIDLADLHKLVAWLRKRLSDENGVHAAIEANGKNGDAAPSQPPPAQQAPQAQVAPAAAEPAQARAPTPARISRPPPPAHKSGPLRRLFSNYTTWSILGIGAFSGALAYTGQFGELAMGAKKAFEAVSGRHIADIPTAWAIGTYAALMASLVGISLLIKRSMARRMAERARKRAERSDRDRAKIDYIMEKLTRIVLNNTKTEDQKSQIRQELRTDEAFFVAMYSLRKDQIFNEMLEDAKVPEKLRGLIRAVMLPGLELEIMQRKLTRLAGIVYKPDQRARLFRDMYDKDEAFRLICDELFSRNVNGDLVNPGRAEDIFISIENEQGQKIGEPLRKGLLQDYDDIISTRK